VFGCAANSHVDIAITAVCLLSNFHLSLQGGTFVTIAATRQHCSVYTTYGIWIVTQLWFSLKIGLCSTFFDFWPHSMDAVPERQMRSPIVGWELWNTIYKVKCRRSSRKKRIEIKRGKNREYPLRWPYTAQAHVRYQDTQSAICGGESITGTGISSSVSITTPMLHTHSFMHHRHYIISTIQSVFKQSPLLFLLMLLTKDVVLLDLASVCTAIYPGWGSSWCVHSVTRNCCRCN
jgi:hypothetical protein